MVDKAREKNLVLMEAAHWYYHPFRQRMQEVIASGVLGEVQHVYSNFCSPGKPGQPLRDTEATMQKIRYSSELAGGAMMDQITGQQNPVKYRRQRERIIHDKTQMMITVDITKTRLRVRGQMTVGQLKQG